MTEGAQFPSASRKACFALKATFEEWICFRQRRELFPKILFVGSIRMGENPPGMSRARTALLRVMRYTSSEPRAIGARSIFDLLAGSKFINSYDTYSGPNASEWNTRSQFGCRLPIA